MAVGALDMPRCGARTRGGTPCQNKAGWATDHVGAGRCSKHGGCTPPGQANGMAILARQDLARWGQPVPIDAHEAIRQCVEIAAGMVRYASEQIHWLCEGDVIVDATSTVLRPAKLEGGADDPSHPVLEVKTTGVQLHAWIRIRDEAMDRLTRYSKLALDAQVDERTVRVAEAQAHLIADTFRRVLAAVGLDMNYPGLKDAFRTEVVALGARDAFDRAAPRITASGG